MSIPTTLFYHLQGIRKYHVSSFEKKKGEIVYNIVPKEKVKPCKCPFCQGEKIYSNGKTRRTFTGVPTWPHKTKICVEIQKYYCPNCGKYFQASIPFAKRGKSYTRRLEKYVISRLKSMTIKDVACDTGLDVKTVRKIHKAYLEKKHRTVPLDGVQYIAIDEFAIHKGHKYMTVVLNLETGMVLHVSEGRNREALISFYRRVKRNKIKIVAIASDMSVPFISAIKEFFPEAIHVFDRFHMTKIINETITNIRRRIYNNLPEGTAKQGLKDSRFVLLKRPWNLNPEKSEPRRLEKALKSNADLYTAYLLKEELLDIWEMDDSDEAEGYLLDQIKYMESTQIPELHRLAKTLRNHALGILSFIDCPISTGRLEGLNNKIKTLKRRGYGYRDKDYFKLLILDINQKSD